MSIEHTQEVFSNRFGTRKAVVCSCGFATTYTLLSNDADELGMRHFEQLHNIHIGHIELITRPQTKPDDTLLCRYCHAEVLHAPSCPYLK